MPGTPPPPLEAGPVSHTAKLPFPMFRVFSIWRSGRAPVVFRVVPAATPLEPSAPSTTMTN